MARILAIADGLFKQGEYKLAMDACYAHIHSLNLHKQPQLVRLDENARLSCHVQAGRLHDTLFEIVTVCNKIALSFAIISVLDPLF